MAFAHTVIEDQGGDVGRNHKLTELANTAVTLETGDFDLVSITYTVTGVPAAAVYLKFYNNGNPTIGTDEPDMVIPIPVTAQTRTIQSKNGAIIRDVFKSAMTVILTITLANSGTQTVPDVLTLHTFWISTKPRS